jgi:hypothetical protein
LLDGMGFVVVVVVVGSGMADESAKRGRLVCAGVAILDFTPPSLDGPASERTVEGLRGEGDTMVLGNACATAFDELAAVRSVC